MRQIGRLRCAINFHELSNVRYIGSLKLDLKMNSAKLSLYFPMMTDKLCCFQRRKQRRLKTSLGYHLSQDHCILTSTTEKSTALWMGLSKAISSVKQINVSCSSSRFSRKTSKRRSLSSFRAATQSSIMQNCSTTWVLLHYPRVSFPPPWSVSKLISYFELMLMRLAFPQIDLPVLSLHGKMKQQKRTNTFFEFCNSSQGILICTDVAARGLDIPAVDYIVQLDPPDDVS